MAYGAGSGARSEVSGVDLNKTLGSANSVP